MTVSPTARRERCRAPRRQVLFQLGGRNARARHCMVGPHWSLPFCPPSSNSNRQQEQAARRPTARRSGRWPGTIAAGSVTDALASTMDLFVTAVELAGGRPSHGGGAFLALFPAWSSILDGLLLSLLSSPPPPFSPPLPSTLLLLPYII